MNVERRSIEGAMQEEALQLFAQLEWTSENLPPAIVLFNEDWHQGVIGIVAGRLKEKFHRPSIVFAPADDKGEMIKGSARSISGIHIRDAIELVATQYAGLITHFGGRRQEWPFHALTLKFFNKHLPKIKKVATEEHLTAALATDGELEAQYFTLELAQLLRRSGPWGQAFPEPLFTRVWVFRPACVKRKTSEITTQTSLNR